MTLEKIPYPGMRNIKTAIAVFLCIICLRIFIHTSPFYACIASVITMQNTVESSWKAGINRMIGTLIGASYGVILSSILPGNALITALGIIATIYTTGLLKRNNSASIACVVYIAIMVNMKDTTPLNYSLMRTFETLFGIIIAMLVNSFIYPPAKNNIKKAANN
jgi:uncharacterized membrane protein YgaE (UPF0421/DUF939 family)